MVEAISISDNGRSDLLGPERKSDGHRTESREIATTLSEPLAGRGETCLKLK